MFAELHTKCPLLVPTLEQYRFCHEVALSLVEELETVSPSAVNFKTCEPKAADANYGAGSLELRCLPNKYNTDNKNGHTNYGFASHTVSL